MNVLLTILANLALQFFLPLLTKWLEQLFAMLQKSKKVQRLLNERAPKTVEEFKALLPELCDLAIGDKLGINHHTKRRLLWAKQWLCKRDRLINAAWNQAIITGQLPKGVALTPAPDSTYGEMLQELMEAPPPMVAGITKLGRPPRKKTTNKDNPAAVTLVSDEAVPDLPLEFEKTPDAPPEGLEDAS